jgi:hypothetical protein
VDSVVASPAVRLDINDQAASGTSWFSQFEWTPGQLTRAISENAMGDGGNVSSSRRGFGSLRVTTTLRAANQDTLATQFQLLTRELDRETNWVEFRADGATKSIYFKTYRSDVALIRVVPAQVGMFMVEYEILTDPYGIGLRETISIGTVNNDPAAGSNGCYFDVTGVIGDVPAPCVIVDTVTGAMAGAMGVRQHGTPSNLNVAILQGESFNAGGSVGIANPGGAADAAMSGASTTNYIRSTAATFAASWLSSGTDAQMIAARGTYRVLAVVRMSDATTDWTLEQGETTKLVPRSTSRQAVDLGLFSWGSSAVGAGRDGLDAPIFTNVELGIAGTRSTGAATIDIDYILCMPADESLLMWDNPTTGTDWLWDSSREIVTAKETGAGPFDGTGALGKTASVTSEVNPASGGFPYLVPNQTNRVYWHKWASTTSPTALITSKSTTSSLTVYYNPAYIFIRPSAT